MLFPTSTDIKPCKYGHAPERDKWRHCLQCKRDREKSPRVPSYGPKIRGSEFEKVMLYSAQRRARNGGFACTIALADIVVPEFCPLLGIKLMRGLKKQGPASPSLDRIKPGLGYVPGNVWVISNRANTIKQDATLQELQMLTERLASALS